MKRFLTVYLKTTTPTKGKNKDITRSKWGMYSTNTLTDFHLKLHAWADEAVTYFAPLDAVTHFCPGIPLDRPIVSGGFICTIGGK